MELWFYQRNQYRRFTSKNKEYCIDKKVADILLVFLTAYKVLHLEVHILACVLKREHSAVLIAF